MAEPQSVSTKPSVPGTEASWCVLVLSVTVTYSMFKQTLNCLIEHLEEEELRVKLQNSIKFPGTLDRVNITNQGVSPNKKLCILQPLSMAELSEKAVSVATALLHLGMLKTGFLFLKCFLR